MKLSFPYRHKQIFMIPNRYGFIAVALFIIFSLVAATYSNNLLFLLAFLHVSFLLISILQTARNLRYVEIETVQIPSGFPNNTVDIQIIVSNRSRQTKLGLRVQCGSSETLIPELLSSEQKLLTLPFLLPSQRGLNFINRIRLSTEAPYGLFSGWLYFKMKVPFYVYPKPLGESLPDKRVLDSHGEFSGLKEYIVGDSLQRISWKHSARTDQLLVKEFKDQAEPQCLLDWEVCPQKESEQKLSQLARWILDCEAAGFNYRLRLPSIETSSSYRRGLSHANECLLSLAKWSEPKT
jgi:uncharacterized protein (DUF58 family)